MERLLPLSLCALYGGALCGGALYGGALCGGINFFRVRPMNENPAGAPGISHLFCHLYEYRGVAKFKLNR